MIGYVDAELGAVHSNGDEAEALSQKYQPRPLQWAACAERVRMMVAVERKLPAAQECEQRRAESERKSVEQSSRVHECSNGC
jgi:hypothetical protein